jgi:hypothetical protein
LFFALWYGRIQVKQVGVVWKIPEFYYRKGGKELQVRSLPRGMEVPCAEEKKGRIPF